MDEKVLLEALLEGPRNERDLPGTPTQLKEMARTFRPGGVPAISWGSDVFALTPAGYAYAEKQYGLQPTPIEDDLQSTFESLQHAGGAQAAVGFFPYVLRCLAVGFGASAIMYVVFAYYGYWPWPL